MAKSFRTAAESIYVLYRYVIYVEHVEAEPSRAKQSADRRRPNKLNRAEVDRLADPILTDFKQIFH